MAKKKTKTRTRRRPVPEVPIEAPPAALNLKRYVDFDDEARKFELPTERVAQIAREVELAAPPVLEFSQHVSESALRERLEEVYNLEALKFQECPFSGCREVFSEIHQLTAHFRLHLVFNSKDDRVRAAVLRDIERTLVPIVEKSVSTLGALSPEERTRLASLLQSRGMLPVEKKH